MSKFYQRDNISNNGIRIDARTGKAKEFGIRGAHRGSNGEIIGGVTADGKRFGTKDSGNNQVGFRIGNPSTPGLDKWRKMNPNASLPDRSPGWLARQAQDETKAAPAGSQQLADRKKLHEDMKLAGSGGLTPEMADRAKALGVTGSSFRRVAGGLSAAPASVAVAQPKAPATTPSPLSPKPAAPAPFGQPTPQQAAISAKGTFAPGQAPPMRGATPPVAAVQPANTAALDPMKRSRARGYMA